MREFRKLNADLEAPVGIVTSRFAAEVVISMSRL